MTISSLNPLRAAALFGTVATGLLLCVSNAWGAEETRELDAFTGVTFTLPYEVEFVAADEPYITLIGDQDVIDEIETRVKGKTLRVSQEKSWMNWTSGEVVITIGYVELDGITMAGSGDGFAEILEAEDFNLRITGSANMDIQTLTADTLKASIAGSGDIQIEEVDADSAEIKIAGSGDIQMAGRVNEQKVSIAGSGDHDASELRSQETTVSIRGSGDIVVWAEARLAASLAGSGDIGYYGNPDISKSIMGSGSLTHLGKNP